MIKKLLALTIVTLMLLVVGCVSQEPPDINTVCSNLADAFDDFDENYDQYIEPIKQDEDVTKMYFFEVGGTLKNITKSGCGKHMCTYEISVEGSDRTKSYYLNWWHTTPKEIDDVVKIGGFYRLNISVSKFRSEISLRLL